jgi:hypothetical protein
MFARLSFPEFYNVLCELIVGLPDHDLSNIFNLRQETNFARTVFFAFGFRRRGKDLTRFEKCQGKKWSLSDGWGKQEER